MADEPAINQAVGLRWKPSSGETGSAGEGTTAVTTAAGGPTGIRRDTISSTLSGSPESSASTVPSRRLRTHPASPRERAISTVQSRKKTPCTRPFTTTRTALVGEDCCIGGSLGAPVHAAMARRGAVAVKGRRKRGPVAELEGNILEQQEECDASWKLEPRTHSEARSQSESDGLVAAWAVAVDRRPSQQLSWAQTQT
ncbi:hypothetical protein Zm00014a_034788 [Zea mays]|uniref:Uncharacterized protein n=1 Tax=Zea mays TaxID=4577 RepID=A0A3L6DFR6_MAIZE|nr:hypothetical protein Zm00014a_034788 [Zea mays]